VSSQSDKDTAVAAGSPVAEQSLRTVIRENVDGMLVIDREGVVVFANPAAERLLGRATRALKGTRLGFPVVAGESSEIDVVAGPGPRTAEMRVVAIGWEGKPAALASLRDVTERKRAEEELRRLSAELESRVRERTAELEATVGELEAFSYSVSHDLRAPLRAIHGFARILEEQLGDDQPPEALDSLERVKAGAKTMSTLIDELLKLSRLGRQPLVHTTVDLSALAHEIVAELRSADPEREVDVSIQQGLRVTGDDQLLRIALVNLLGNAFKFTLKTTRARVEISGTREGENLSVQIRDNGAGFDPEHADRLFRPFQRLHAKSEFAGIGIGLTTVERVIHRHGGSITASGAIGRGASFACTLPAATEPVAATANEAAPTSNVTGPEPLPAA
jgi:signal transduction histidine kinase